MYLIHYFVHFVFKGNLTILLVVDTIYSIDPNFVYFIQIMSVVDANLKYAYLY